MVKICYIIRGLPGTGKSALAKSLSLTSESKLYNVFSTDDFFMDANNGQVVCVIDNTNTMKWEYEEYEKMAESFGFMVQVISIDWDANAIPLYAERNTHGVPVEAIERMVARWEY